MAFRNIQIDIDDAVFQAALNRATGERKAIGELVVECLTQYARSAPAAAKVSVPSTKAPSGASPGSRAPFTLAIALADANAVTDPPDVCSTPSEPTTM